MRKLNILLVRGSEPNGVSYHRLFVPHNRLKLDYEYNVYDCNQIEEISNEDLRLVDIVVANRTITGGGVKEQIDQIKRVQECGAKFLIDLDDYWYLHHGHELSKWWNDRNITSLIETNIKYADHIIVTHDLLGSKTKKEYTVLENAIDSSLDQFKIEDKVIAYNVNIGWVGSSNHYKDISLLKQSLTRLNNENANYSFYYCGFNKQMKHCKQYEEVLTGGYTADQYFNVEGQPVDKYAYMYDLIDVAVIPLVDNEFNNCKSNLKMLEAGFKKKAVIVSGVHPYTSLINHGVNSLQVKPTDKNGWYKEIMKLLKNKELITTLAEQLYKDVQDYEIRKINEKRLKLYGSIGSNPNNQG